MKSIPDVGPIFVSGGSGYIASWILRRLLEAGHTVHATVRDPQRAASVEPLHKLAAGLPGQLKLFKADLLQPGSFDEAVAGCRVALHTASPFLISGIKDPEATLIRPALEGTRNVLGACTRSGTVQRVVVTSSVAAIYGDAADLEDNPRGIFNEDDWNTTSSPTHQPYSYSKLVAEQEAWKLQQAQNRWSMATVNPGFVFGPALTQASQSTSIETLLQFGSGKLRTGVPHMVFGCVDVRDVAEAHIRVALDDRLEGRFILSAGELSMLDMATILRSKFGSAYPFPRFEVPKPIVKLVAPIANGVPRRFVERNAGHELRFDNRRSRELLGIDYRSLPQTLIEHFQQLIDDGLLPRRPYKR